MTEQLDDDVFDSGEPNLGESTLRAITAIKEVYPHNVYSLEEHVGRLVLQDFPAFLGYLTVLPTDRDRRAAIYLLIEETRRAMSKLQVAVKFFNAA